MHPLVHLTQGGPAEDTLPAAATQLPLMLNQGYCLPHSSNILHTLVERVREVSVTQSVDTIGNGNRVKGPLDVTGQVNGQMQRAACNTHVVARLQWWGQPM